MSLKNYFKSNEIDFVNDLDACIRAYNDPQTLNNYFRNYMSSKIKSIFRLNLSNKIKTERQLTDVVVDKVRIFNKRNKNWIIVKAPIDIILMKKLIAENLNPIQIVFFCDTDPVHKVLLYNELSISDRNRLARETSNYIKNEMRYRTTIDRVKYPEFVENMKNISKSYVEEDREEYEEEYDKEYNGLDGKIEVENFGEDIENDDHDNLMKMIMPEIIKRLKQYTDDLIGQWNSFQLQISKEVTTLYMDFNVIQCKPDSTTNMLKNSITNTIYYIQK